MIAWMYWSALGLFGIGLAYFLFRMHPRHHAKRLWVRIRGHCIRVYFVKGKIMVTLDTTQQFTIMVAPVDAAGNPGLIDGPATYPVDTQGLVTIVPAADGLSALVRGSKAGKGSITPTALANGKTITGPAIDFTVTNPPEQFATQLVETIGQVVPQGT
jgi:hypothetical protein